MKAIIFSKDRPLQLDACLRSLVLHAADPIDPVVIWTARSKRMEEAYDQLRFAGLPIPNAGGTWHREDDFEANVRHHLGAAGEHVLFAVDDTVFVRRWSPARCSSWLAANHPVLGASLRLGTSTRWCYPTNRAQEVPPHIRFESAEPPPSIGWRWTEADGDFGYPLEVSSSIYRTADILEAIEGLWFRNPNELEAVLAFRRSMFERPRPWLMSYETSVAFSVPCNRVQNVFANRAGTNPALSAEALLEAWEQGYRVDVEALAGHVSRAAHEEIKLPLRLR